MSKINSNTYLIEVEDDETKRNEKGNQKLLRIRLVNSSYSTDQDNRNDFGALAEDHERERNTLQCV